MRVCSMNTLAVILAVALPWCLPDGAAGAEGVRIVALEPTPLFPKVKPGEPLRQIARLKLENGGPAVDACVKITAAGQRPYLEPLGRITPKESVQTIHIPDIAQPAEIGVELHLQDDPRPVDSRKFLWIPQKKWRLYCVAYSHHDLGFGDYPHRLRTTIRHANITRPLQFCRDSDGWDEESKFRFVIETSEPLTSFLGSQPIEAAEELGRRLREGRIRLGGLHNTASTEQLGHELMARLFYLSNRHARDLLAAPKARTAQIDDVIGLTWPLATYLRRGRRALFLPRPERVRPLLRCGGGRAGVLLAGALAGQPRAGAIGVLRRLRRGQSGRPERGTRAEHHRKVRREVAL